MAEEKKGLFEKLYGATKEAMDEMKKPIVRRQLKRKFQDALDSVSSKIVDAEIKMQECRSDIQNFDINKVLEMKLQVINSQRTKKEIEVEYQEMFGEEMKQEE